MICQVETLLTKQLVKEYNTKGQCKQSVFQCSTIGNTIIQVAHYFHGTHRSLRNMHTNNAIHTTTNVPQHQLSIYPFQ